MNKIKNFAILALLFVSMGFAGLSAYDYEINEEFLEGCLTEAHDRGYDIESDAFINRIVKAIHFDDNKTLNQMCPKTNKEYH
ncbi:hypothetical protein [Leptospira sp. GIMC2001]|uniref:hypothetical protein n=1 Tax=Leptospira sp. GIMC2001 TaxID=1513297 RepID=UPI00234BA427|nr:hypothetical protein [Leptospira sp. GIMC2001]WCL50135.1 hypothetical protein O4O04_04775 [Leptospira sp. GIMC2001]